MIDGILLQTVEGLGDEIPDLTDFEIWECLQAEKEEVTLEILSEGPLCQSAASGPQELEISEETSRAVEWRHRGQLEARLRKINEAQDRLMEGAYGRCADCHGLIDSRRLASDPAASLCITCQRRAETDLVCCPM